MGAIRLAGLLAGVLVAVAACGGGTTTSTSSGTGSDTGGKATLAADPNVAPATDCGVTLADVEALAPSTVSVSVRDETDGGDEQGKSCWYYWIYDEGGLADPGNVHIYYSTTAAKNLRSGIEQGIYGQPEDLAGVGDKAWVFSGSTLQLIAIKGNAVANIQVRYFPDQNEATRVATAVAKRALGV